MPSKKLSFPRTLTKDLFKEAQDLFKYIEKEKNAQLELIGLIKGVQSCSQETFVDPAMTCTRSVSTTELKTSDKSQKCIQTDLSEVMQTKGIPKMCSKEVSCDSFKFKDQDIETVPIISDMNLLSPGDDMCAVPTCINSEEISCSEISFNETFEERKFKCETNNHVKCSCSSSIKGKYFKNICSPNIYIYSVENIYRKMCNEQEEWSKPFYTSYAGYRMSVKLGYSCKYVGVYVKMVKGDFDDSLTWPFKEEISFTLMNQINEEKNIIKILKPQPCDCDERGYWIKPEYIDPNLGGWGLRKFMEKKSILGPNRDFISDFIRNDRIYIKIKLLF